MNEQWKQWALKKNPDLIDRKVIEDIKAEIENEIECYDDKVDFHRGVRVGLNIVVQIIDKHTKGDTE